MNSEEIPIINSQDTQRKSNKKWRVVIYVIVTIVIAAATGFGVWFYMNQQIDKRTDSLKSELTTKDKTITKLNTTISALRTNLDSVATSTASTTEASTATNDEISNLTSACNSSNQIFYAKVPNGIYGGCPTGGSYKILKETNGSWSTLYNVQQMSGSALEQAGIPINVVVTYNAYDLMPY